MTMLIFFDPANESVKFSFHFQDYTVSTVQLYIGILLLQTWQIQVQSSSSTALCLAL